MTDQTLEADPNLKIPAAVRASAERADTLHRTLRDNPEPDSKPQSQPQTTVEDAEIVTSEGNPDLDASKLSEDKQSKEGEEARSEKPSTEQVSKDPEQVSSKEDDQSWEHKYKTTHGRLRRSQEQIRDLTDQVQSLQNIIATMQVAPSPKPEQIPELNAESLITPEEAADYGEDFLKVVGKRARQEITPLIEGYKTEIAELKRQLEGVNGFVKQDSQQKLLARLDERLPDWRKINTNQDFLDWLGLPDPYSGVIRHDMLKAAYAQGDAPRVLAFFNGFLAEEAAVAPASAEPDPATQRVAKVPLEKLAAPGRAKTAAATNAPAEKPIITRAQVAAFYADVASGKYRGRDEAKSKAENQIFEAQRDGRLR